MSAPSDDASGPIPLSGDAELTTDERLALRQLLRERDRQRWIGKKLRNAIAIVGVGVSSCWALVEWFRSHVKITP